MYLLALGREPMSDELRDAMAFFARKEEGKKVGDELTKAKRQGWEDFLWAMVNTKEFLFNH